MTTDEMQRALALIQAETDLNAKALLLAGLVSELFREHGFEPVVVGGAASEFSTDGACPATRTSAGQAPGRRRWSSER